MDSQRRDPTHMSSAPAALSDVADFLRAHPPFDALAPADVERAASSAEVEFFLAGAVIFAQGPEPIEHLRVVRTGAVEIVLEDRVLDLLARPESVGFVARSLLEVHEHSAAALSPRKPAPDPASQPVSALIHDRPLLCSPGTTIREAAAKMASAPASSIVVELGGSLGILTDRDLRARVVAAGVS